MEKLKDNKLALKESARQVAYLKGEILVKQTGYLTLQQLRSKISTGNSMISL